MNDGYLEIGVGCLEAGTCQCWCPGAERMGLWLSIGVGVLRKGCLYFGQNLDPFLLLVEEAYILPSSNICIYKRFTIVYKPNTNLK